MGTANCAGLAEVFISREFLASLEREVAGQTHTFFTICGRGFRNLRQNLDEILIIPPCRRC
jgi:hypothetical protein